MYIFSGMSTIAGPVRHQPFLFSENLTIGGIYGRVSETTVEQCCVVLLCLLCKAYTNLLTSHRNPYLNRVH